MMNELLAKVVAGNDFEKGIFLMICGLVFVFAVQLIFYAFIKIASRQKKE
jgi:Na+-transporting methylmalonyl-CoA/oxaloacetate decarboxylase gamma subunit